ncbi:MAG: hypothetical protein ACR2QF_08750 [Geminicoccaceae bacterium]
MNATLILVLLGGMATEGKVTSRQWLGDQAPVGIEDGVALHHGPAISEAAA